jgi:dTDP-4-amino-4,6-dideoxy-D-galactose acyltransferase
MIKRLDWDSNFFGYEIGKMVVNPKNEFSIGELKDNDYKLIYVFSDEPIDTNELILVDTKVIFHKLIEEDKKKSINSDRCEPFNLVKHDLNKLENMAIESGKYSRFKLDSNFQKNEFERLYLEWIYQSYQKKMALEVLVYSVDEELAGFITITNKNKNLSDIGLVAVDPKFQGKGIGGILLDAAEKYSFVNGYKEIQVVTQEDNINAAKLYRKKGFDFDSKTYIYHYWSNSLNISKHDPI